jgi:hypothetical protein
MALEARGTAQKVQMRHLVRIFRCFGRATEDNISSSPTKLRANTTVPLFRSIETSRMLAPMNAKINSAAQ